MGKQKISRHLLKDAKDNQLHLVCKNIAVSVFKKIKYIEILCLTNSSPELIGQLNKEGYSPLYFLQKDCNYFDLEEIENKFKIIQCVKKIVITSGVYTNATQQLLEEMLFNRYDESPLIYSSESESVILGDSEENTI